MSCSQKTFAPLIVLTTAITMLPASAGELALNGMNQENSFTNNSYHIPSNLYSKTGSSPSLNSKANLPIDLTKAFTNNQRWDSRPKDLSIDQGYKAAVPANFKNLFTPPLVDLQKPENGGRPDAVNNDQNQPSDVLIYGALELIPGVRATEQWQIKIKNLKTGRWNPTPITTGTDGTFIRAMQPGTYLLTPIPPQRELGNTISTIVSCETSRDRAFQPTVNVGCIVAMVPATISGTFGSREPISERRLRMALVHSETRDQTVAAKLANVSPGYYRPGSSGGAGEQKLTEAKSSEGSFLLQNVAPGLRDVILDISGDEQPGRRYKKTVLVPSGGLINNLFIRDEDLEIRAVHIR